MKHNSIRAVTTLLLFFMVKNISSISLDNFIKNYYNTLCKVELRKVEITMLTSLKQRVYDLMYPAKTLYNASCICNSTFISMNFNTAEDARKHMVRLLIGMGIDEEEANKVLEHDTYSTPNFSVEIEPYTQRELAVWCPPLEFLIECSLAITLIIVGCRVIF